MDNTDIQILLHLAETGNLTRTAAGLYMGQSTLTKRLQKIEQELGTPLFLRSRTGLTLTPLGEHTIQVLKNIDGQMTELRSFLRQNPDYVSGSLTVASSLDYSHYRLPEVLQAFVIAYPQVDLQIATAHSSENYSQLNDGRCQVAIIRGEYDWDGEKHLLSSEPLCLIRRREDIGVPLQELRYISRYSDKYHMSLQTRWLIENQLSPESTLHVDTIRTCRRLTEDGLGWSIVPAICLDGFEGEITPLYFADGTPLVRNTYIMYRESDEKLPQVREFVRIAREHSPMGAQ